LRKIADEYNAEFEIIFFNTPLWRCIERDSKRGKPV
jgi:predicted kinase